jgi:RNA polymerase sigma-70 factor, ECF subfamily
MAEPQVVGEFEAIVRQHQAMVFSIAYHLLHDRTLAEEVAQDVFLQLNSCLPKLQSAEHVLFWLRKVTVHRAIDAARSRKSRPEIALEEVPEPSNTPSVPDPLLSARLRQLVASLPENARAVVVLRYQEDMGPEEISRALAMPVATVKSHLQRALAMLRDKVTRTMGEVKI